jgi:hypothetical protein
VEGVELLLAADATAQPPLLVVIMTDIHRRDWQAERLMTFAEPPVLYQAIPPAADVESRRSHIGTACVRSTNDIGSTYISVPLNETGISDVQLTAARGCTLTGLHLVMYTAAPAR